MNLIYKGLMAPTSVMTSISVKRTSAVQIDYPYSECRTNIKNSDSILVKSTLARFSQYRQSDCFDVKENLSKRNLIFLQIKIINF
jgi:hypothetical protein